MSSPDGWWTWRGLFEKAAACSRPILHLRVRCDWIPELGCWFKARPLLTSVLDPKAKKTVSGVEEQGPQVQSTFLRRCHPT